MKRWLLIDDSKTWDDVLNWRTEWDTEEEAYPDVEFHKATTYYDGRAKLEEGGWDKVYIDWDLNCGPDETGYDILDFLYCNRELIPGELEACSWHGSHCGKMQDIMNGLLLKKKTRSDSHTGESNAPAEGRGGIPREQTGPLGPKGTAAQ